MLIVGIIKISFGLGKEIVTLSTIEVKTYFRIIAFYILLIKTLFLLYLKNIDRLSIIFDNTRNRISNNTYFKIVK
ncbi:hypothetical protein CCUS01_14113 [Colletotrichum cuscutae]|uniref:Uncharacterized protein n=1 Tax=Colletotrichum cuscutae TaxID=1209917 RepID=A0AAJ0DMD2_9PEZI|nr:hypothetical protein CCUS01_14113 [Colletotrichum cuscutae]